MGACTSQSDLRKAELAFKGDLDYLKGKVSRLAVFGGVLLGFAVTGLIHPQRRWAR